MTRIFFRCCLIVFMLVVVSSIAEPVYAHGDEPRLEISVERMNPGGVVDVRGISFEPESTITLMLVNSKTAIPLGEITADTEGVFLQIITLPVDTPEGEYNFLAITDDHNITSPDLTVTGAPIYGESGGQGPRDEDDGLLAPMPTLGVDPGTVPVATQVSTPGSNRSNSISLVVVITLIVSLFGAGLFILQKRKR